MATDNEITKAVFAALSTVQDPDLNKDLVTLNMIKDLVVEGDNAKFRIVLTTPACPLKGKIEKDARDAVMTVPGINQVEIKMDAVVVSDGKQRGNLSLNAKHVVAVASGKGGVGKSTVSVNLAVALAQTGAKVGLLDADIYGPNIPTMMGVDRLPPFADGKIIPAEAYGVKVMSIGFLVEPGKPLIWRGPMLHSAIRQFLGDVLWGDLDYFIIDLPPGTGDAQLSLVQSIPLTGGIIVTLPQAVSLEDASRGLYMFKQLNVPILGVVENMSYLELPDGQRMEVFGNGAGEKLSSEAGAPFLGKIPMMSEVREGGDLGRPIVAAHPDAPAAQALRTISENLAASLSIAAFENKSEIKLNVIG